MTLGAPAFDEPSADVPALDGLMLGSAGWPERVFMPEGAPARVKMETEHGDTITLRCARWHRPANRADRAVLARCEGPVLDVGCGPGRHVAALAGWGRETLGIDTSATAVNTTRLRGGPAVQVSIFD